MSLFRKSRIIPILFFFSASVSWSAPRSGWQQSSWGADNESAARRSALNAGSSQQVAPFTPGSNNFAVDVGQVFLMGDLGANYSDNIGAQLHYTYGVSDLFGFDASFGYSEHSDGKFSMATLLGGLRTNLAWYDKVVPYVVFGLGFYRPSYQQTLGSGANTTISTVSPVLFGVHLGPGVDLEITRQIFFGAAITFHDVFGTTKPSPTGPISVGGTFTSFLLHAGFTF